MTGISEDVIQEILRAKFGSLLDWKVPEIVPTVGPYEPEVFSRFDRRRSELISQGEEKLENYPTEVIDLIRHNQGNDPGDVQNEWRRFLTGEIANLKKNMPPWYAGGFGHPDYVADFDYWAKMASFRLEEVLCVSVGIEPEYFPKKKIEDLNKRAIDTLWPPMKFLLRRHDQFRRQFDPHNQNWKVRPDRFLIWANEMELDAHPEFMALLEKYHSAHSANDSSETKKRTDQREVDSIAQLFTAMAIEYYGYRPDQAKSPVTKEITDLVASMGMTISEDTVRKYLKHGAKFIPEDWKPSNS